MTTDGQAKQTFEQRYVSIDNRRAGKERINQEMRNGNRRASKTNIEHRHETHDNRRTSKGTTNQDMRDMTKDEQAKRTLSRDM